MSAQSVAVIIVAVVVLLIIVTFIVSARMRARRQRLLRSTFGPEYDVALSQKGSRAQAERELEVRQARHDSIALRALTPQSRQRYMSLWEQAQARFVDRPRAALDEADELIRSVMVDRGYPVDSFEQQTADLSVEHANTLSGYRRAHELLDQSSPSTEGLRQAMISYRQLFVDLVEKGAGTDEQTQQHTHTGRHAST